MTTVLVRRCRGGALILNDEDVFAFSMSISLVRARGEIADGLFRGLRARQGGGAVAPAPLFLGSAAATFAADATGGTFATLATFTAPFSRTVRFSLRPSFHDANLE